MKRRGNVRSSEKKGNGKKVVVSMILLIVVACVALALFSRAQNCSVISCSCLVIWRFLEFRKTTKMIKHMSMIGNIVCSFRKYSSIKINMRWMKWLILKIQKGKNISQDLSQLFSLQQWYYPFASLFFHRIFYAFIMS